MYITRSPDLYLFQLSHATPAGLGGAHNPDRNAYAEIAQEMFFGSGRSVIMGIGNPLHDNQGHSSNDPAYTWISKNKWNALQNRQIQCDEET